MRTLPLTTTLLTLFAPTTTAFSPPTTYKTITPNIAILGGGASGSHVAVQLPDANKSVIVIEQQGRFGGHLHPYHESLNGLSADYGVQIFQNPGTAKTITANFLTGRPVDLKEWSANETVAAFGRYSALHAKYSNLDNGVYLPSPVPDELLQSFNVIVAKYNLQPLVPVFNVFLQGWPDFDRLTFFYVLRYVSKSLIYFLWTGSLVRSARDDDGEVYRAVQAELGGDALVLSTVAHTHRPINGTGVYLWVQTPDGIVLGRSKKLLLTMPTVPSNMASLDPDAREASLFAKLQPMNHLTGLLRHTGTPQDTTLTNVGEDTTFHSIQLPGSAGFTPTADPLLHGFVYISYEPTTEAETEERVLAEFERLRSNYVINGTAGIEVAAIKHHSNYALGVSADDISDGF